MSIVITSRSLRNALNNAVTTFLLSATDDQHELKFTVNVNFNVLATFTNPISVPQVNTLQLGSGNWHDKGVLEGDVITVEYTDPTDGSTITITPTVLSIMGNVLIHDGSIAFVGQSFPFSGSFTGSMTVTVADSLPEQLDVFFNLVQNQGSQTPQSLIDGQLNHLRFNTAGLAIGGVTGVNILGNKSGGQFVDIDSYANVFNYATGQAPTLEAFEAQIGFPLINGAKFGDTIVFDNVGYTVGDNVFENVELTGFFKCSAETLSDVSFGFNSIEKVYLPLCINGGRAFPVNNITHLYAPVLDNTITSFVNGNNIQYFNTPVLQQIGDTTGDDNVFQDTIGNNVTAILPSIHQTSNGGNLEGDLQYLDDNNNVTFVWDGDEVPTWIYQNGRVQRITPTAGFQYSFEVTIPFYNWLKFQEAETTTPVWYEQFSTIKPFTRVKVFRQANNPNGIFQLDDNFSNGNAGWYNENYNQGQNPFTIQSVDFEDENGDPLNALQLVGKTIITAVVTSPNNFSDTSILSLYNIPFSDRYKNKPDSFFENIFATFNQDAFGLGLARWTIIDQTADTSVNGEITFTLEVEPTPELTAFFMDLPDNDRYFRLAATVQTGETPSSPSNDRTSLLLWQGLAEMPQPTGEQMTELDDFELLDHNNNNVRETLTEDDILVKGTYALEKASNYTFAAFKIQVVRSSDDASFDLFSRTINLQGYPVTPTGVRLIDYLENLGFELQNPDRNTIKLKFTGQQGANDYEVEFLFNFINSWRYWNINTAAFAEFLDITLPQNGINDEWVRYAVSGYTFRVRLELTKNGVVDFFNWSYEIADYDTPSDTVDPDNSITTVIQVVDENDNVLPGIIHGQQNFVKAIHTRANGYPENLRWAWNAARQKEQDPRCLISSQWTWAANNLPLLPLDGETEAELTISGTELICRNKIDANLLSGVVTLVARVQGGKDKNVHKSDFPVIRLPQQATFEDRGYETCGEPRLALGHTTCCQDKNDIYGVALIADSITLELEQNGILYPALGYAPVFPEQPDAVGFVIDWRQNLQAYGAGCYKLKVSYVINGVSGHYYDSAWELMPYSIEISEGTVQLLVNYDSMVKADGINYKGSGFYTSIRFQGFFGDEQINSEHVNLLQGNDVRVKVRNIAAPSYTLKTRPLTRCLTRPIKAMLLHASNIWVSDFNAFNHEQYRYFNAILSEDSGIEFEGEEAFKRQITAILLDKNWTQEAKYATGAAPAPNISEILECQPFVCDPATFEINGIEVATIPSGQGGSIKVLKQTGTDEVGSLAGTDWRISDSVVTLVDTASPAPNALSTTNVPATESAQIVAPDASISNSDGSYTASVPSGGSLTLPDETINITDQDGNILDSITFPVYTDPNIDISTLCPDWKRPLDWLPMPTVVDTDQTFVGLHAVIENGDNYVAFRFTTNTGDYQVDWGDGTVTTHASNTNAEHQYDFTNPVLNGTLTSRGYKQAMITVTPVSGNLLTCNFQQRFETVPSQTTSYSTGFLDCILSMPNASSGESILFGGILVIHRYVERFDIKTIGGCTALGVSANNGLFRGCTSLQSVPLFDTSGVINMREMFLGCTMLRTIPLFDTSGVTGFMLNMFNGSGIITIPQLNTANVANMTNMFSGCVNLQSIPLLNTSSVTQMLGMFFACGSLNSIPALSTASITTDFGANFANIANSLNRCQMVFQRTVSFNNCQLSRDAIVEIFNNLATVTTAQTITITNNWGVTALSAADLLIATNKGWTVTQ
jgi:hypothetical protein